MIFAPLLPLSDLRGVTAAPVLSEWTSTILFCCDHIQINDCVLSQAEEHAEAAGGERCRL